MPSLKTHKAISKRRTGSDYARLHRWMDIKEGINHRQINHNLKDIGYLKRNWRKYGKSYSEVVKEFLHHITLDWQSTEKKFNRF